MLVFTGIHRVFFVGWASLLGASTVVCAADKASVEQTVLQQYRQCEAGYLAKDVDAIFHSKDAGWTLTDMGTGKVTSLADNREAMADTLSKVKSLKVKIDPIVTDMLGDSFFIRYKQTHEVLFPMKDQPGTSWFIAEDTWTRRGDEWRVVSTRKLNESTSHAAHVVHVRRELEE